MRRRQTETRARRTEQLLLCRGQLSAHCTLEKLTSLAWQDLAEHFGDFLSSQRVPQVSMVQCMSLLRKPLSRRDIVDPFEPPSCSGLSQVEMPGPQDPQMLPPPPKRQKQVSLRTEILGSNPKERRAQLRAALEPGYCLCRSGKKRITQTGRLRRVAGSRLFRLRLLGALHADPRRF